MARLLLDQMLPAGLCERLAEVFEVVEHVARLRMNEAADAEIWDHARQAGLTIVTKDADYQALLTVEGPPPRVVWLRLGNASTAQVENALRRHAEAIRATHAGGAGCLIVRR